MTSQLGRKSMDRDSLRREKSDLKGKSIVASISPTCDTMSILHLQKKDKMLKIPPTLEKETKATQRIERSKDHKRL